MLFIQIGPPGPRRPLLDAARSPRSAPHPARLYSQEGVRSDREIYIRDVPLQKISLYAMQGNIPITEKFLRITDKMLPVPIGLLTH